jgi:hypothetical protein
MELAMFVRYRVTPEAGVTATAISFTSWPV